MNEPSYYEDVLEILKSAVSDRPHLRPTELYNEGWMLKLILKHAQNGHYAREELQLLDENAIWYTEAMLPTRFKAEIKRDELAESHTNADGAIGHITIGGDKSKEGLSLNSKAEQFVVLEAKMGSPLSKGISKAENFNQAARNVACMAHIISLSEVSLSHLKKVGFHVLMPADSDKYTQSARNHIQSTYEIMDPDDGYGKIRETVEARVESYKTAVEEKTRNTYEDKERWYQEDFLPLLEIIDINVITWDELIQIPDQPEISSSLHAFYQNCIKYNGLLKPSGK